MRRAAFSLVEIIVVVALLSVIVLGLLAMFTQTQRAFRVGLAQTDVLEAGRISMELLKRELGQLAPSDQPRPGLSGFGEPHVGEPVNFYAWLPNVSPLYQPLPGGNQRRTNLLEDVFFIYPRNREWVGVGYFVRTNNPANGQLRLPVVGNSIAGAGTLYRFESSVGALTSRSVSSLYAEFRDAAYKDINFGTNIARIVEGVVHFKIRAFNTDGRRIIESLTNNTTDISLSASVKLDAMDQHYYFFSNAVPAAVELEMGILENRTWQHYRALPTPAAQYNYLTGQVGRVHLFRERVPNRNVDSEAYQ